MAQIDELERLHTLLQKGALTAEEFAAAKARLLSNTVIWGVCGRLGQATPISTTTWRLLFLLPVAIGFIVVPTLSLIVGFPNVARLPDPLETGVVGSIIGGPVLLYAVLGLFLSTPAKAKDAR
jgi:hypothetical protein